MRRMVRYRDDGAGGGDFERRNLPSCPRQRCHVSGAKLIAQGDVNVKDRHDATPLMYAAAVGSVEAVKMLLAAGADAEKIRSLARRLVGEQRTDGGWPGNPHLESDAYSTAQTLCALHESGALAAGDEQRAPHVRLTRCGIPGRCG